MLAYDVGAHTHQIASQWRTDLPGTMLATNGWSSMGFGIPATYAAKLAHPDRAVVGVIGDGCFQMTAGELAAGRRLGLAAPIVVLTEFAAALDWAFALDGPSVVEAFVDPDTYMQTVYD